MGDSPDPSCVVWSRGQARGQPNHPTGAGAPVQLRKRIMFIKSVYRNKKKGQANKKCLDIRKKTMLIKSAYKKIEYHVNKKCL